MYQFNLNEKFQMWQGNCLDLLPLIPDGVVDAIITDLPYGTTACEWDSIIPLGPMWREVKRMLKPKGAFVTTSSQPFTTELIASNRNWFRYEWVWSKSNGVGYLNANRQPLKRHENILVFADGQTTYNPQKTKGKPYCATSGAVGGVIQDKTVNGWNTINLGERYPTSVLEFQSVGDCVHPTQKPVALYEYLIKTYTNPNELILDFCFGSGTTAIATYNVGGGATFHRHRTTTGLLQNSLRTFAKSASATSL